MGGGQSCETQLKIRDEIQNRRNAHEEVTMKQSTRCESRAELQDRTNKMLCVRGICVMNSKK